MKSKPCEMSLVGGGVSAEEMNKILGARCVCSEGSVNTNVAGGFGCQCSYGNANFFANAKLAIES